MKRGGVGVCWSGDGVNKIGRRREGQGVDTWWARAM